MLELEHSGTEVLVVRLNLVQPSECEGAELSLVYCQVLRTILDTTPGCRRTAMLRHCATLLTERRFCKECWRPIDDKLHQLINVWKQPVM